MNPNWETSDWGNISLSSGEKKKAHINLYYIVNLSTSPLLFEKDNPSNQNQKVNKRTNFKVPLTQCILPA